jgi:hypothetical protein
MKTNAAIKKSVTKEIPLEADVDELLNGSDEFTPVGIGGKQLDTPCIKKKILRIKNK